MIADGQTFITTRWQLSTIPGLAVVITGIGLSLLGDGLADLLRPRVSEPVLEVRDLHVEIPLTRGTVHAVDGVSFTVGPGRGDGAGRRVRLGQEHDAARHPRAAAPPGGGSPAAQILLRRASTW